MRLLNHLELENYIERVYDKSLSSFIHGGIGIGKSETVIKIGKKIAEKNSKVFYDWNRISDKEKRELLKDEVIKNAFVFADIRLSQADSTDLKGIPTMNGDFVEWKPNLIFRVLSNPQASGFLFFDECNQAPPSVQASAYQIVLDRCIGEISFPKTVVPIACGNRIEDRGNVFELSYPLANRFTHSELRTPTIEEWTNWGLSNGHKIDSRILAYLHWKPSSMYRVDTKSKDKAFPTPRTWSKNSVLIDEVSDNEMIELLSSTTIGEATAIEFVAFLKTQGTLDAKDFLDNPNKVKKVTEIDQKYALISAITEYYKKNKTADIFGKCGKVCLVLEPEFGVLLFRFIKATDDVFWGKEWGKSTEFTKFALGNGKYLL